MPTLFLDDSDHRIELNARGRAHWFIGRGIDCDLILGDAAVSRFHATVFQVHEQFYVVDHSLNGTHLCADGEDPSGKTRLPSVCQPRQIDNTTPRIQTTSPHDTAQIELSEELASAPHLEAWEDAELNKSHAAFRREQLSTKLPRMVGYLPHSLHTVEDMRPLLQMIYSSDGAETLSSMGRTLRPEVTMIVVGLEQHPISFSV